MGNWTTTSTSAAAAPPPLPANIGLTETGTRVLVGSIGRVQATMQVGWIDPGTGPAPTTAHYSLNVPAGVEGAAGDAPVQIAGTIRYIQFPAWAPGSNQSWSVTIALETATASSGTITSPTTTIYAIGSPSSHSVTGGAVSLHPYTAADGTQQWVATITANIDLAGADGNLWLTKLYRIVGRYVGGAFTPASWMVATPLTNDPGFAQQQGIGVFRFVFGPFPYATAGGDVIVRYMFASRSRQGGDGYNGGWVSEVDAFGTGVDHCDTDVTAGVGTLDATRIASSTLGSTLAKDGNGKLYVAPYSLDQSAFQFGALSNPVGGAWSSAGYVPPFVNYGIPSYLGYNVGATLVNTAETPPAFYRNSGYPNGWVKSTNPADVSAGNLAATVAILGTVLAGQIQAGTIGAAISLTAPTISVTSGTVVVNIDGTNYVKVSDSDSTYPRTVQVTNVSAGASGSGASGQKAQAFVRIPRAANAPGEVFLQDAGGTHSLRLIPSSVAGATPPSSTTGFLVVNIDGSQYWIPFYSAF